MKFLNLALLVSVLVFAILPTSHAVHTSQQVAASSQVAKCPKDENQFSDTEGVCRICMEGGCLENLCPQWAKRSYCVQGQFTNWMLNHCPISCGVCIPINVIKK